MRKFSVLFVVIALFVVGVFPVMAQGGGEGEELPSIVEIAAGNEDFSTLVAAIEAAGLVDFFASSKPITVFAPTNAAFEAAFEALGIAPEDLLADTATLTSILLYHVVPGAVTSDIVVGLESATTLNGADIAIKADDMGVSLNDGQAKVAAVDIMASNGVIHVIDGVILPPAAEEEEMAEPMGTIVDIAAGNEAFGTLVAAVQAAGLVDALSAAGPYTVFAPTNDAFAAALSALGITAEDLLADTETLTSILLYHVAPGKFPAAAVVQMEEIGTLNGATIKVMSDDMGVSLNDGQAKVVTADVMADNGIIHVIDGVILPPAAE
ncbi:MAG: fasciclin domain-containing protein [Aggregatilineaceae bacterium]